MTGRIDSVHVTFNRTVRYFCNGFLYPGSEKRNSREKASWGVYIYIHFSCCGGEIQEKMKIKEGGFILAHGLRDYSLSCWEDMMAREAACHGVCISRKENEIDTGVPPASSFLSP